MNILVTGGAGFIATHLCRELVQSGNNVSSLDLKEPLDRVVGVRYEIGDVRDLSKVEQMVGRVDCVYHFAADVGVELCEQQPAETYATNFMGTLNILQAIEREGKRGHTVRIVFSGSAVVYGAQGDSGVSLMESSFVGVPLSFYGAQKLAAEQMIQLYAQKKGVPAVCFRFFNVYGSGQDPHSPYSGVISIFVEQARTNKLLYLNGGGVQTRDFIHVSDIVNACVRASSLPVEKCDGSPMNLGSGKSTQISKLAKIVAHLVGGQIQIKDRAMRAGDILHSTAEIARAKEILDWTPRVDLEKGLLQLIK